MGMRDQEALGRFGFTTVAGISRFTHASRSSFLLGGVVRSLVYNGMKKGEKRCELFFLPIRDG